MPMPFETRVGFYGKLPARGDFVCENLRRDFVDSWDAWWQRGFRALQSERPEEWRAAWLEAPVWHFVLPPGVCGKSGVVGLWMPSVDSGGRYFPFTIAATADVDWVPFLPSVMPFLKQSEQLGLEALDLDLPPAEVQVRVLSAFATEGSGSAPPPELCPGEAAWWTQGGPRVAARLDKGNALPEGEQFAALISESWGAQRPSPVDAIQAEP